MSEQKFTDKEQLLSNLFEEWSGEKTITVNKLPQSGSSREYFRLKSENKTAIGAFNSDYKENVAFITYSKHFKKQGLRVPEIFKENLKYGIYLQEDLGHNTLFSVLEEAKTKANYSEILKENVKKVVVALPEFQFKANQGLDYSVAYPREAFDKQSMHWDLSYFKYYFLKLAGIEFNEQSLENDFSTLIDFLNKADSDYFLFRDFQSRNIMMVDSKPWFIDYQGGRKGALQYDLASLLYDAKANIPQSLREELVDEYIENAKNYFDVDPELFKKQFYPFVLIRIMQAMGAYGFRGFYEKKSHFLKSIPFAISNLKWILDNNKIDIEIPHLMAALNAITSSEKLLNISKVERLNVTITSFSYKKGIPQDTSGNGGGYVFDCRWIHNPGRYEPYKKLTGRDQPVIEFLDKEIDMKIHLDSVYSLVDRAVERFIDREFSHIMVNFGCTGGQHRSVYSAEHLARHLNKKFNVKIKVHHIEQNILINDFK
ncbi:MAG: phosphotransferase [Flavobacteriales bacterium]|nr:phosphotransferase [Flavobacteriales bacterium]